MTIASFAAIASAALACATDLATRRIPNVLTLVSAGIAFVWAFVSGGWTALGVAAAGWALGLAIFLPLFALRALGGGDVKLLAALGAWIGPGDVIAVALYAAVAGGPMALVLAWLRGYRVELFTNVWSLLMFWRVSGLRPHPTLNLARHSGPRLPVLAAHRDRVVGDAVAALNPTRLRPKFGSERGAELLELAIVLPILLLVVAGIMDFGFLFQRWEVITNAAREGARLGSLPGYTGQQGIDRASSYLDAAGLTHAGRVVTADVPVTVPLPSGPPVPAIRVTVRYPSEFAFLGPIATLLGGGNFRAIQLTATSVMRLEGGS